MRPTTARIIITLTILAVVIYGVGFINSAVHGSFIAGLFPAISGVEVAKNHFGGNPGDTHPNRHTTSAMR